ncbi:hypothetical protein EJ06DRAFT_256192 [Trichodelitschia bisporula]|uniref:Berberine/berberine-like domain-containing protein n=1 Tax=Trichodelitschia bisporula TaxID=703511 RepID=A0A6G1HIW1_9PEZI|nr:hypothetical protein EJ06DRAFT_256192 [Trichodelitschia bisporula]
MKTFNQPSMPTAMLTVSYGDKGRDGYLDAMAYFFAQTPKMNDFGVTGYPVMSETSYGGSLTGPGKTEDEVRAFVTPMVERMRALGAKVSMTLGSRLGGMSKGDLGALAGLFGGAKGAGMGGLPKGDLSALAGLFGGAKGAAAPRNSATLFYGPDGSIRVPDVLGALHRHRKRQAVDMSPVHQTPVASMASRLLARSALSEENIPAIRAMLANVTGFLLPYGNLGGQVSKNKALDVGVNPAWREASMHLIAISFNVTNNLRAMDGLSVDSAAYLNEAADVQEKDWKRTFWGPKEHYARLLEVKKKYDPTNTLWCFPCVGADVFAQKEGRLYVS